MIDEFDAMCSKPRHAEELLNFYEAVAGKASNIVTISITNSIETLISLKRKHMKEFSSEQIVFKPYTPRQMFEILRDRLSCTSLGKDYLSKVFNESSLLFCAKKSSNLKGSDIRASLDMLLKAFNSKKPSPLSDLESNAHLISIEDVQAVCNDSSTQQSLLSTFPLNQRVLLAALYRQHKKSSDGKLSSKEVFSGYSSLCTGLQVPAQDFSSVSASLEEFEDYKLIASCNKQSKKTLPTASAGKLSSKSAIYSFAVNIEQIIEAFCEIDALKDLT